MIDTHAHLNFKSFEKDYQEVIKSNFEQGLKAVINIGTDLDSSKKAIQISKEFDNCYAAIGLHPIHVNKEDFVLEKYQDLIKENKENVKAIGETGLDYYQEKGFSEKQKEILLRHISLAQEFDLPLILHCRGSKEDPHKAYQDLWELVSKQKYFKGVVHCFSSNWEKAKKFLKLGSYIGFTGPITFKNSDPELLEVVDKIPLDRVLLETDCPFLAPEPYRGERNEPIYIRFMAQKIAEIKGVTFEKVVEQTTINARNLFRI